MISLVLLAILVFLYFKPIKQKYEDTQKQPRLEMVSVQKNKQDTMKINHKETSKSTVSHKTISVEPQTNRHTNNDLYEPLSLEEAKMSTPARKNIAPIAAIRMTQEMSQLHPNDMLTLSDIEGEDYTLTIHSIYQNNDGSTSTTANYTDEGITYTTTITQSEKSTYITLSTANGLYEIETRADTGYIYRTDSIRKALQSRTPNDVIILPIPKTTPSE